MPRSETRQLTEIVLAVGRAVSPLALPADVHAVPVDEGGAPGLAVRSVGEGAPVVLLALVDEGQGAKETLRGPGHDAAGC